MALAEMTDKNEPLLNTQGQPVVQEMTKSPRGLKNNTPTAAETAVLDAHAPSGIVASPSAVDAATTTATMLVHAPSGMVTVHGAVEVDGKERRLHEVQQSAVDPTGYTTHLHAGQRRTEYRGRPLLVVARAAAPDAHEAPEPRLNADNTANVLAGLQATQWRVGDDGYDLRFDLIGFGAAEDEESLMIGRKWSVSGGKMGYSYTSNPTLQLELHVQPAVAGVAAPITDKHMLAALGLMANFFPVKDAAWSGMSSTGARHLTQLAQKRRTTPHVVVWRMALLQVAAAWTELNNREFSLRPRGVPQTRELASASQWDQLLSGAGSAGNWLMVCFDDTPYRATRALALLEAACAEEFGIVNTGVALPQITRTLPGVRGLQIAALIGGVVRNVPPEYTAAEVDGTFTAIARQWNAVGLYESMRRDVAMMWFAATSAHAPLYGGTRLDMTFPQLDVQCTLLAPIVMGIEKLSGVLTGHAVETPVLEFFHRGALLGALFNAAASVEAYNAGVQWSGTNMVAEAQQKKLDSLVKMCAGGWVPLAVMAEQHMVQAGMQGQLGGTVYSTSPRAASSKNLRSWGTDHVHQAQWEELLPWLDSVPASSVIYAQIEPVVLKDQYRGQEWYTRKEKGAADILSWRAIRTAAVCGAAMAHIMRDGTGLKKGMVRWPGGRSYRAVPADCSIPAWYAMTDSTMEAAFRFTTEEQLAKVAHLVEHAIGRTWYVMEPLLSGLPMGKDPPPLKPPPPPVAAIPPPPPPAVVTKNTAWAGKTGAATGVTPPQQSPPRPPPPRLAVETSRTTEVVRSTGENRAVTGRPATQRPMQHNALPGRAMTSEQHVTQHRARHVVLQPESVPKGAKAKLEADMKQHEADLKKGHSTGQLMLPHPSACGLFWRQAAVATRDNAAHTWRLMMDREQQARFKVLASLVEKRHKKSGAENRRVWEAVLELLTAMYRLQLDGDATQRGVLAEALTVLADVDRAAFMQRMVSEPGDDDGSGSAAEAKYLGKEVQEQLRNICQAIELVGDQMREGKLRAALAFTLVRWKQAEKSVASGVGVPLADASGKGLARTLGLMETAGMEWTHATWAAMDYGATWSQALPVVKQTETGPKLLDNPTLGEFETGAPSVLRRLAAAYLKSTGTRTETTKLEDAVLNAIEEEIACEYARLRSGGTDELVQTDYEIDAIDWETGTEPRPATNAARSTPGTLAVIAEGVRQSASEAVRRAGLTLTGSRTTQTEPRAHVTPQPPAEYDINTGWCD